MITSLTRIIRFLSDRIEGSYMIPEFLPYFVLVWMLLMYIIGIINIGYFISFSLYLMKIERSKYTNPPNDIISFIIRSELASLNAFSYILLNKQSEDNRINDYKRVTRRWLITLFVMFLLLKVAIMIVSN